MLVSCAILFLVKVEYEKSHSKEWGVTKGLQIELLFQQEKVDG